MRSVKENCVLHSQDRSKLKHRESHTSGVWKPDSALTLTRLIDDTMNHIGTVGMETEIMCTVHHIFRFVLAAQGNLQSLSSLQFTVDTGTVRHVLPG